MPNEFDQIQTRNHHQLNEEESTATASVYTHSRALRRNLDKLSADRPEECRLVKTSHGGEATELTAAYYEGGKQ